MGVNHQSRIYLNAIAVLLVFSTHFGAMATMPTIFRYFDGLYGVSERLAYQAITCSFVTVFLTCPIVPLIIGLIGLKPSLIVGTLSVCAIHISIIYPRVYIIIIASIINGFGCALLRVSSLKFLTDQSIDSNIVKNNTIHWCAFKSSILFGNLITFLTIGFSLMTIRSRIMLGVILLLIGIVAAVLYGFIGTKEYPCPNEDDNLRSNIRGYNENTKRFNGECDESPLIKKERNFLTDSFNLSLSSSFILGGPEVPNRHGIERIPEKGETAIRGSLRSLLQVQVLFLAGYMAACGVYDDMYGMILPTETGKQYNAVWSVSAFGMVTGVGELAGSLLVNPLLRTIGTKKAAISALILTLICFTGSALFLPLSENRSPIYSVHVAAVLTIGFGIGVCDVVNSVVLSSTIATCYKDNAQFIYALYVFILNAISVTGLFLISYSSLMVVMLFFTVCLSIGTVMFCFMKLRVQY